MVVAVVGVGWELFGVGIGGLRKLSPILGIPTDEVVEKEGRQSGH